MERNDNNKLKTFAMFVLFCVDGDTVDVQYSNWENGEPETTENNKRVVVTADNRWRSWDENDESVKYKVVCQSQ